MSFIKGAMLEEATAATTAEELAEVRFDLNSLSEVIRKRDYTLEERVALYAEVNPLKKDAEKMRESLRNEIVEEVEAICEKDEASGRLALKDAHPLLSQNGKGAIVLTAPGVSLELRPKAKEVFDPEKATAILTEAGLLDAAQESVTTVKNVAALHEAIEAAINALFNAGNNAAGRALDKAWDGATQTVTRLSEERILALVTDEKLDGDKAAEMFDTKYSYSLYEKEQK